MTECVVLNSSAEAVRVAELLGVRLVEHPRSESDAITLVVVGQPTDVVSLAQARERGMPIGAAIAWHLQESDIVRLLDLDVPVFIGLPSFDDLVTLTEGNAVSGGRSSFRAESAQFAALEATLRSGRTRRSGRAAPTTPG